MAGTQHQIHTLQSALRGIHFTFPKPSPLNPELDLGTSARMQDRLLGKGVLVALNSDIK